MKEKTVFLLGLFLPVMILSVSGCKSEDPELPESTGYASVTVTFVPKVGNSAFYVDSVYASDSAQAYHYYFELFKFYISHLELVGSSGKAVLKDVDLIDFGKNTPYTSFEVRLTEEGDYHTVRFGLGLDSVQNASDPGSFPVDHPMSSVKGTHWGWTDLYRYIMIEGRVDTAGTGTFNLGFAVHTGFNKNYREQVFLHDLKIRKGQKSSLIFEVDIHEMLFNADHPTNFRQVSVSHSDNPLNTLLADNLMAAISLKQ